MLWDDDMELAIALAREAAADGEVPVGAVVLDADGRAIGRGRNLRETHADRSPTPKCRPCVRPPLRLALGISLIAHLLSRSNRAPCVPALVCRRTSAVSSSARGTPNWVRVVRFGTFRATRTSDLCQKSSVAYVKRNADV